MEILKKIMTKDKFESEQEGRKFLKPRPFYEPLIIVDPLNLLNNIGKSSYNFHIIQEELKEVY